MKFIIKGDKTLKENIRPENFSEKAGDCLLKIGKFHPSGSVHFPNTIFNWKRIYLLNTPTLLIIEYDERDIPG